ncbi:hypothetical protein Poli38472_008155 [Pythium oligandrum]|uniref:G-patch domain-containing protein n=1 Tax=Pythium oligandrum TaxID=41045 RepID=A0A8K1CNH9_PYTOL|nr:hypothetical protein Poli38472_008155 [Pythium oligandrum]|eukprot:TMW65513.1 hypothetical protein Poli38472_008155 [Pythium oligandrum]
MTGVAEPAVPLVGKKYMNKLGSMVNESAASEISAFARKQMEKMGWTDGKGLGKDEQGMTTYVRVKKREENMGVGGETVKVEQQQNQWWYNVYDKLADKIKIAADSDDEASGKRNKKKKSKKEKKSKKKSKKRPRASDASEEEGDEKKENTKKFRVPTDEELFAATGGKLFGRRAYGSCNGKLKRDQLLLEGKLPGGKPAAGSSSTSDSEDEASKKSKKSSKKQKTSE